MKNSRQQISVDYQWILASHETGVPETTNHNERTFIFRIWSSHQISFLISSRFKPVNELVSHKIIRKLSFLIISRGTEVLWLAQIRLILEVKLGGDSSMTFRLALHETFAPNQLESDYVAFLGQSDKTLYVNLWLEHKTIFHVCRLFCFISLIKNDLSIQKVQW